MINDNLKPDLSKEAIKADGPLKQMLIDYVGTKLHLDADTQTVSLEMVVNVIADEFPEFVLALAEENFLRGYQQALQDIESLNVSEPEEMSVKEPDDKQS